MDQIKRDIVTLLSRHDEQLTHLLELEIAMLVNYLAAKRQLGQQIIEPLPAVGEVA